jgi:hypothetical protein
VYDWRMVGEGLYPSSDVVPGREAGTDRRGDRMVGGVLGLESAVGGARPVGIADRAGCEGGTREDGYMNRGARKKASKPGAGLKKSGAVASVSSWAHQHPLSIQHLLDAMKAMGLIITADLKALVKLEPPKARLRSVGHGWMREVDTGRLLSPEEHAALRKAYLAKYGRYLKSRGGKRKDEERLEMITGAVVEEIAYELSPWVNGAVVLADAAGHDVRPVIDFLFDGDLDEVRRILGFPIKFEALHAFEGILHKQLTVVKVDDNGRKMGLRPNSRAWSKIPQPLGAPLLGAMRWQDLGYDLGTTEHGYDKGWGIKFVRAHRMAQSGNVYEDPWDVAMKKYVDGRTPLARARFEWFGLFLDRAEIVYRTQVEEKLAAGQALRRVLKAVREERFLLEWAREENAMNVSEIQRLGWKREDAQFELHCAVSALASRQSDFDELQMALNEESCEAEYGFHLAAQAEARCRFLEGELAALKTELRVIKNGKGASTNVQIPEAMPSAAKLASAAPACPKGPPYAAEELLVALQEANLAVKEGKNLSALTERQREIVEIKPLIRTKRTQGQGGKLVIVKDEAGMDVLEPHTFAGKVGLTPEAQQFVMKIINATKVRLAKPDTLVVAEADALKGRLDDYTEVIVAAKASMGTDELKTHSEPEPGPRGALGSR